MPSATTAVYTVSRPTALRTPVSQNRGTAFKRGSATCACASSMPARMARATATTSAGSSGLLAGVVARRARAASTAAPWPLGGSCSTSWSRYAPVIGVTHSPRCATRSSIVRQPPAPCTALTAASAHAPVTWASRPPRAIARSDSPSATLVMRCPGTRLLGQAVPRTQVLGHARPLHRRGLPDGEAVLRQRDGRLQHGGEVEPPVARHELFPGVDHTRHRHHQRAALVPGVGHEAPLERQRRGCGAGAVEADDGCSRFGDQREGVAADAGRVRLDDAEHRVGGHGRVDCAATLAERPERGLDREPVRGRHHRRPRPGGRRGGRRARSRPAVPTDDAR